MITTRPFLTAIAGGLLAIAAASQLCADEPGLPIAGSASFFGAASASGASCEGCTTTVFFSNNWSFVTGTGIYAGIPPMPATFASSFTFTGDGNITLVTPVPMLWAFTFGGNSYSFDLLTLSSGRTRSAEMAFTGSGVLHATGYDPTPANIGMTGSGNNFDYQLSFVTVPEPGSLALAGCGLAVCAAIAYLRRR